MSQEYINRQIGDFVPLALIEHRASVELYRAVQQSLKRFVLLKILFLRDLPLKSEQLVKEFKVYVNHTTTLENLHLQPIYGLGTLDEDSIYVAGKLMSGSLFALLETGLLPPERALVLAIQITVAMIYLHSQGLIHSSLSPRTVYLSDSGDAYLDDLELSRIVQSVSSMQELKQFLDDPFYASVEQLQCIPQDFRSEVYGFGATLYHMTTGSPPFFESDNSFEMVLQRKLQNQLVLPSHLNPAISPAMETIILRSLRADSKERFSGTAELEYELEQLTYKVAPTPTMLSLLQKLKHLLSDQ